MSATEIFVVGVSHHTAPLEVRERLALDPASEAQLHARLAALPELRELAVLNTCNRVEFYGVGAGPAAARSVQAVFCAHRGMDPAEFEKIGAVRRHRDAVRHLLEVASGVDSQIVGETEIFGQVKESYAAACRRGSAGAILNRLFQKTFQAAKHVRTHTAVGAGQVSVASVAVDLAQTIFGRLDSIRILLLGAGEIGEKTARAFRSRHAGALAVASRNLEHASELASRFGAETLPFERREERLAEFDVVVSAAASGAVWSRAAAAGAMKARPARPLFFIDLGLPRNVEESAAAIDNVFLYNLDDLAKVAADNRAAREAETARCRQLLSERAEAVWRQIEPRLADAAAGGAVRGEAAAC